MFSNLLNKFNQIFGFTPTEGRVVIFLVVSFVVGLAIKQANDSSAGSPVFDYASADSEFAARSALLSADRVAPDGDTLAAEIDRSAHRPEGISNHTIDINTATKDELVSLPGIGEAMAERIILYREENGKFQSIDELMNVKGIGKKKLERIQPYCTVEH